MSDKLNENEKFNFRATLKNIRVELDSVEKELDKEFSYKYYVDEKLELIRWRIEYLKGVCVGGTDEKF